jgi:hypothetical protein
MAEFFVDTSTGQVATRRQLREHGIEEPARPWLRIQGPDDATTLWHAVLVKRERGLHIGTLTLRHGEHHASLIESGWSEIEPALIGSGLPGHDPETAVSPSPWTGS